MGVYQDLVAWASTINNNVGEIPEGETRPAVPLELKIIKVQGMICPGFITVDLGQFDAAGRYYPSLTRSCSIKVPTELFDEAQRLLNGTPTDEDVVALISYAQNSPEFKAHILDG